MEFLATNQIKIDPPKKPKKLTATRFATILGLNAWSTPFEAWCAITRTYEEPFEDSIYTIAGKVIEPRVIDYLNNTYFMEVKSPTDVYGQDYFRKTWGDFFPNEKIFGGMWDVLGDDFVVEIKTTKRAEDWAEDVPVYYKLQACLYAYLLGFDSVVVTASFLEPADYDHPEKFIPSYQNTKMYDFSLAEAYPDFEETYIQPAIKFWNDHVETGLSPEFCEKKDAAILKALRTNNVAPEDDEVKKLLTEADKLKVAIDKADERIQPKRDRLKEIQDQLKMYMVGQFRDGDKKVELSSKKFSWTLTKSVRNAFDSKAFKAAKPDEYDDYVKQTETYTLKNTAIEAE